MGSNDTYCAENAQAITLSDTTTYPVSRFRAFYVGGTGDIKVDLANGATVITFSIVPAGSIMPIRCIRFYSTGSTATNIIGLL